MIYIIEGADMTGKTTLAKALANKHNLEYEHVLTNPFEYYKDSLLTRDNVVFDRHFISEMLYPKVFAREPKLNWGMFEELVNIIKENRDKIKIVITTADEIEFLNRLNDRPDEPQEVIGTLFDVNKEFLAIATLFDIVVVNPVDYTLDQIEEMLSSG